MRILVIGLIALGAVAASIPQAQSQSSGRPTVANEADYHRAMKELSNWGRWGKDDELGAANLITPAKRKQATALVTEGVAVSLAHDAEPQRLKRFDDTALGGIAGKSGHQETTSASATNTTATSPRTR